MSTADALADLGITVSVRINFPVNLLTWYQL